MVHAYVKFEWKFHYETITDWMQEMHAGVFNCPAWHESEQFSDLHFRNSFRDNFLFWRFSLFFCPAVTNEKNKKTANNFILCLWDDENCNNLYEKKG